MKSRGIVLGVGFDSTDMSWFLSKEKSKKVIRRCKEVAGSLHVDLKQVQRLMGSVNDLGQMCPLVKCHKRSGNELLTQFSGNENLLKRVPDELKEDLQIIAKVAESAKIGLPIAEKPSQPPLSAISFYTDAAGASFSVVKGVKMFHNNKGRGVACLAGTEVEDIWAWTRMEWPDSLLNGLQDEKGRVFGCKSTTLESVGLLLPLLVFPEAIAGKHIVFWVDNIAVLWGWKSGYVKMDRSATEVLKSVRYLAGHLGVTVHVNHVDRVSNGITTLADELSRRESSKNSRINSVLKRAVFRRVEGYLLKWLEDPNVEKSLFKELLKEI